MFKISFILILSSYITFYAYGFDLKSQTDKFQKDLGEKLNIFKNSNSNPLAGLLKELNQNKSTVFSLKSKVSSQPNSSKNKLAKQLCETKIPQFIKDLPEGNIADLENDFGQNSKNIKQILKKIPNYDNDQVDLDLKRIIFDEELKNELTNSNIHYEWFVSSLKPFEGAFETLEVELLFRRFIQTRSINYLSKIQLLSGLKTGFNIKKKQIKVDAIFAYGLIHYYYRNVGGNKKLGFDYIKKATLSIRETPFLFLNSPDNIGALAVYGAWQFNGINTLQKIQSGNMSALNANQRARDKKLELNRDLPFKGLKAFEWAEIIFLSIAADKRNPYKEQYLGQLAKAVQIKKDLEKYDSKGGWWPFVNQQQDRQHQIISMLAYNIGIGEQVSKLKDQYRVLEGKVDTDNSLVERKVVINNEMKEKVLKAMNSRDTVDEKGMLQITNLAHDNEVLILNNDAIMIKMMAETKIRAGFGDSTGFRNIVQIIAIMSQNENIACNLYSGIKSYAAKAEITMLKSATSKHVKTKSRFKKSTNY